MPRQQQLSQPAILAIISSQYPLTRNIPECSPAIGSLANGHVALRFIAPVDQALSSISLRQTQNNQKKRRAEAKNKKKPGRFAEERPIGTSLAPVDSRHKSKLGPATAKSRVPRRSRSALRCGRSRLHRVMKDHYSSRRGSRIHACTREWCARGPICAGAFRARFSSHGAARREGPGYAKRAGGRAAASDASREGESANAALADLSVE